MPLEYYPPATNMINYLAGESNAETKISAFSTHNTKKRNVFINKRVKIYRTAPAKNNENIIFRLLKYFFFQVSVLLRLIFFCPNKILYYESLSSFPVFLYTKIFNRKTAIFVHYHEYTTPDEYQNRSMKLECLFHKLEQTYIYNKAVWVSHTNKDRLNFFIKDNPSVDKEILKELPNYPPKSWLQKIDLIDRKKSNTPLKCVYVGALSLNDTYIKEFSDWVILQNGKVLFDIFTYNMHQDTDQYLQKLQSSYINFVNTGIEYEKLPLVLSKYHVGIILYKGNTKNYEYNAPNKLFEYLICGLDVWFPDVMKGIIPYIQMKSSPKVISLDFNSLDRFKRENFYENKTKQNYTNMYICDLVFEELKNKLFS